MPHRNDDDLSRETGEKLTERTLARAGRGRSYSPKAVGGGFSHASQIQITQLGVKGKVDHGFARDLPLRGELQNLSAGLSSGVSAAIRREPALAVDEYRRIDSDRCEEMLLVASGWHPTRGSRSVEAGVKLLGHRAKLLGLETPSGVEMTGKDGARSRLNELRSHKRSGDTTRA